MFATRIGFVEKGFAPKKGGFVLNLEHDTALRGVATTGEAY